MSLSQSGIEDEGYYSAVFRQAKKPTVVPHSPFFIAYLATLDSLLRNTRSSVTLIMATILVKALLSACLKCV